MRKILSKKIYFIQYNRIFFSTAFLHFQELLAYMKKEYSHENLRFWLAVQELKRGPGSETKIKKKVKEIYE